MERTTINISQELRKKINQIKILKDFKTQDEVIELLLKNFESK